MSCFWQMTVWVSQEGGLRIHLCYSRARNANCFPPKFRCGNTPWTFFSSSLSCPFHYRWSRPGQALETMCDLEEKRPLRNSRAKAGRNHDKNIQRSAGSVYCISGQGLDFARICFAVFDGQTNFRAHPVAKFLAEEVQTHQTLFPWCASAGK